MTNTIVVHARPSELSTDVVDLTESIKGAEALALEAVADNTRRAYAAAWKVFVRWCATKNLHPGGPIEHPTTGARVNLAADPGTLVLYVYEMVSGLVPGSRRKNNPNPSPIARRPSTVAGHLAAIDHHHGEMGLESHIRHPRVKREVKAAKRRHLGDVKVKKDPVLGGMLSALMATLPDSPTGVRDRALVLFSYGGAFRRDDVTSTIKWQDIVEEPEGLRVWLEKSKTDQTGKGRHVLIFRGTRPETCAAEALAKWRVCMAAMQLPVTGKNPVFVSLSNNRRGKALDGGKVALVVKTIVEAAGFDPKKFAAHSLRSGWITTALDLGTPMEDVQKQPGHKNSSTTDGYDRRKWSWQRAPGKGVM